MPSILDYRELEADIVDISKSHIYEQYYDTNFFDIHINNYFSMGHKDFHESLDHEFEDDICNEKKDFYYFRFFENRDELDNRAIWDIKITGSISI